MAEYLLSQAAGELAHLAESLLIPVLTTASGRGSIPEDHPLAFGLVGIYRTRISKKVYEEADLIITVGSKNEEFETGAWKYFPERAKLIQIDIDPFEIGRNLVPDVALVGDAKLALKDLAARIAGKLQKNSIHTQRVQDLQKAKSEYESVVAEECKTDEIPIRTKRVVRELNEVFGKDTDPRQRKWVAGSVVVLFPLLQGTQYLVLPRNARTNLFWNGRCGGNCCEINETGFESRVYHGRRCFPVFYERGTHCRAVRSGRDLGGLEQFRARMGGILSKILG